MDPVSFYAKIVQAAQGLMSIRLQAANVRKAEAQTGKLGIEEDFLVDTRTLRKMGIILGNEQRKTNTKLGDQLLQYRGGGLDQSLINPTGAFSKQRTALDAQIDNMKARTIFQNYENQLRRQGITSSDSPWLRLSIKALNAAGIDPVEWIGSQTVSEGLSRYNRSKQ